MLYQFFIANNMQWIVQFIDIISINLFIMQGYENYKQGYIQIANKMWDKVIIKERKKKEKRKERKKEKKKEEKVYKRRKKEKK